MANGLADTVRILPFEPLKALIELQHLDLSNNKLKNVPDTSFHFLYNLRTLNLQDNEIDHFSKGTLQVGWFTSVANNILVQHKSSFFLARPNIFPIVWIIPTKRLNYLSKYFMIHFNIFSYCFL